MSYVGIDKVLDMKFRSSLLAVAALSAGLAAPASAATILSTTGSYGADPGPSYVGFVLPNAFTGVGISFTASVTSASSGTAYLTTSIGPGTTVAQQLASVSFAATTNGSINLFSGLSLASGTYYLTVAGETFRGFGWELGNSLPAVAGATEGDTENNAPAAYVPGSKFDNTLASKGYFLDVNITGTSSASAVPEPASVVLLGIAIAGIAGVVGWRRRGSQAG